MKIDLEVFDADLAVAKRKMQISEYKKYLSFCVQNEQYDLVIRTTVQIQKLESELGIFEKLT